MHRLRISFLLAALSLSAAAWAQAPARRPVRRGPRPAATQSGDANANSDAAAPHSDASGETPAPGDGGAAGDASAAGASDGGLGPIAIEASADGGAPSGDAGVAPGPASASTPPADNAPPSTQGEPRMLIALVDTAPVGVDPAAAGIVTDNVRQMLQSMGYATVSTETLYAAARALHLPFPVPPAGLEALLHALNAPVAVAIELQGGGGYYQPTVRVRFAAEPVERYRRLVATQFTLLESIRGTLPGMLAPPQASPLPAPPAGYPYPAAGPISPYGPGMPPPSGIGYVPPPQRPRRPARIHPNPWDVALGVEVAIGPGSGHDFFVNFLAGARAAFFPVDRFGISLGFSYANVRGRQRNEMSGMTEDVRYSNILPMVGIETGIDVARRQHIYLPLRAEIGYLPYNGPVFRLTGALAVPITRDTRLEFDILTPTFWFVPGATLVTLDMGVQLVVGFGRPPPRRRHRETDAGNQESSGSGSEGASPTAPAATPPPAPQPADEPLPRSGGVN